MLLLYKLIIRPVTTYVYPLMITYKTISLQMEKLQNKIFPHITSIEGYVSFTRLNKRLGVVVVNDYILKIGHNFYKKHNHNLHSPRV